MQHRHFNVLFLCTGNSARSILAECLLRRLGRDHFQAFSAGSFPKGEVHSLALTLLVEQGVSTAGLRSKSWDEFAAPDAPVMDFVFTVCDQAAGEICAIWPGNPMTAHWGIPDPAAVEGNEEQKRAAFRDAASRLDARIKLFVALPLDKLDRMAIKHATDTIGHLGDTRQEAAS